jgi:nucleoside-diphosphate-sugar epimerase
MEGVEVFGTTTDLAKLGGFTAYKNFTPVETGYAEYTKLHEILKTRGFDVLYHLAWQGTTNRTDSVAQLPNIKAAADLACEAAALDCQKIVFISTLNSYLIKPSKKLARSGECSVYGSAKLAAWKLLQAIAFNNDTESCLAMLSYVFGPGDRQDSIHNQFIRKLLSNEELDLVDGDNLTNWIYIDDVVDGLVTVGSHGLGGAEYYIGGTQLQSFKEIITAIRAILESTSQLNFGAYRDEAFIDFEKIDLNRLHRETGYKASSDFASNIIATANWLSASDENAKQERFATRTQEGIR